MLVSFYQAHGHHKIYVVVPTKVGASHPIGAHAPIGWQHGQTAGNSLRGEASGAR